MNIYIASHSSEEARKLKNLLLSNGFKVTSTWHDVEKVLTPSINLTEDQKNEISKRNRNDLYNSDCLVLQSGPEKYSGGKFIETGIAIGLEMPVFVLGRYENIMLYGQSKLCQKEEDLINELDVFLKEKEA